MQREYKIDKSRLYGSAEYSVVLRKNAWRGYALTRVDPGEVEIASAVCFFDPYDPRACRPFSLALPQGTYRPFMLTVSTDRGKRVALAGLDGGRLSSAAVWKLALHDEEDVRRLLSGEGAGTDIGSGLGALCDYKTFSAFFALVRAGEHSFHPLDGAVSLDGGCAQICAPKGVRLPVFSTGWGEGSYNAYFGMSAEGEILGVLCDFGMVQLPPYKSGQTESVYLDESGDAPFLPDPDKSDAENGVAQYSGVIERGGDASTLFAAYSRRGYAYHTLGKYDEALADYREAIRLGQSHNAEVDFALHAWSLFDNAALICRNAGRTEEAITLYEQAKAVSDTFYSGAYAGLIDIYGENKNYEKALAVADEMVAARPQDPSAYLRRSEIYMACEEYEKAVADLDVLINAYKLNESILDKALCLSFLGRHADALAVLDTYLVEGRASEVYYDVRAGIHLAAGDYAAAYTDAQNAYAQHPDYLGTLEKLIELDGLTFRYRNVAKWATRYIEARPHAEYGYSVRADAHFRAGNYEDSVADYAYILHNIADTPRYRGLAVKAALSAGNRGQAKKYAKSLRKTDTAYYIYSLGLLYLHEKKYARAERFFASALALREDDTILSALIDCNLQSGQTEKARLLLGKLSALADGEEFFIAYARVALRQGADPDALVREYADRCLGGATDENFLHTVREYFRSI